MGKRRELTDRAFMEATLTMFGVPHTALLVGWCVMAAVGAPRDADRAWYLKHGPMSQATRYRMVRDLLRLRQALLEQGYDVDELEVRQTYPPRHVMAVTAV